MDLKTPATQEKEKLKVGDLVTHRNSSLVRPTLAGTTDGYEYGIVTATDIFPPGLSEVYKVWWIKKNRHHSCYLESGWLRKLS